MIKGFDCFDTPPKSVLDRARSLGFGVICQYYGTPTSPKVLTAAEAQRISEAGLLIFSVFEKNEGRPLTGKAAGVEDSKLAVVQARACGQPLGSTICFAVDTDKADPNKQMVRNALMDYFTACRETLGTSFKLGCYGPGAVLEFLAGVGLVDVQWLAGAMGWPGSRAYAKTDKWHILQHPTVDGGELGISYDPDDIRDLEAIGAWSLQAAAPPGPQVPHQIPTPGGAVGSLTGPIDLFRLQTQLKAEGCYSGAIDGIALPGGATAQGIAAYSAKHRPPKV